MTNGLARLVALPEGVGFAEALEPGPPAALGFAVGGVVARGDGAGVAVRADDASCRPWPESA